MIHWQAVWECAGCIGAFLGALRLLYYVKKGK